MNDEVVWMSRSCLQTVWASGDSSQNSHRTQPTGWAKRNKAGLGDFKMSLSGEISSLVGRRKCHHEMESALSSVTARIFLSHLISPELGRKSV